MVLRISKLSKIMIGIRFDEKSTNMIRENIIMCYYRMPANDKSRGEDIEQSQESRILKNA